MPVGHRVDGDLVELTVTGAVSGPELISGFKSMLEDDRLPSEALVLVDVVHSEAHAPPDVMHRIAMLLRAKSNERPSRIAILVAHPVRYGLARQLGARLEPAGIHAQPFHDRDAALSWLRPLSE